MTVAVLRLDLAILSMDHELRALVLSDLPRSFHSLGLAVKRLRGAASARATDGPAIGVGNYVLITLAHHHLLRDKGAAHVPMRDRFAIRTSQAVSGSEFRSAYERAGSPK